MVQFVDLVGLPPPLSPRVEATIARAFQNQVGATLDPETMRTDILTATGSDRFEFLTYTGTEKDGKTGALIGVRPKSYGPPFLATGPRAEQPRFLQLRGEPWRAHHHARRGGPGL